MSGTDRILATYRITAPLAESRARAEALAIEQSIEVPLEAIRDEHIRRDILARVDAITPAPNSDDGFDVTLAIAAETTGHEISQLMNMLFGNCAMHADVALVGVEWPAGYTASFPGPRFGIAGIRDRTGAHGRAMTCTAIKPQGSTLEHLKALARTFALAGIDVIKDDHGLTNQAFSRFADRVPAIQRVVEQANRETGGHTCYAPTFSGGPKAMAEQIRIAKGCGAAMAMVAPMLVGLPLLGYLREELDVPLLAHPSGAGSSRITADVLIGQLYRLFGADAVIFANHGGRFAFSPDICAKLTRAARAPWDAIAPALPVAGGGMTTERVHGVLDEYGIDTMLLVGGGLLVAREALLEQSRAFVERVASYRSPA
ncbi:MAG: RuBisCO large subunit C-terminal-like domain-containing protein [Acidobacteriota bacterium]